MLTVIRDAAGRLQACCESRVVNQDGQLDPHGVYVWIEQLECNPDVSARHMIAEVIEDIALRAPKVQWAYWERRDKTGHRPHGLYSRAQTLRWAHRQLQEVSEHGRE